MISSTFQHYYYCGFQISSWYTDGETWYTQFAELSSSYEECRAECVGIYLCTSKQVLRSGFSYKIHITL